MAPPICMSQDGNAAVFIGTWLENGEPVALCSECLVPWSSALINALTGIDPEPFLAAALEEPPPLAESEPTGPTPPQSPAAGTDADPHEGEPPAEPHPDTPAT